MPGRHQVPRAGRPRLRWLAGGAGAAIIAALALAYFPASADASGDAVAATFSVTGVSTSNCSISTGGSDVYVKPGQDLDVKSSVVGLTVLGHPVDLSQVASFDGALVVDPSSAHPIKLDITNKVQTISGLSSGNHAFTWTVRSVRLLGALPLPLGLSSSAASAGAKLAYSGVIHVTPDAAQCGVAVQVPGVGVSASVTHLPPVNVNLPGVKVTVPVNVPSLSVPNLPGGSGGGTTSSGSGGGDSSGSGGTLPVPARIVPRGDGGNGDGDGGFAGTLPGASALGNSGKLLPASSGSGANSSAAPTLRQDSTGKHKTIDLASNKAQSTGQFSVILAIIAIIALSVVAATYARLYLLRREA